MLQLNIGALLGFSGFWRCRAKTRPIFCGKVRCKNHPIGVGCPSRGDNLCSPRSTGICLLSSVCRFAWHKGRPRQNVAPTSPRSECFLKIGLCGARGISLRKPPNRGPVFSATSANALTNKWSVVLAHTETHKSNRIRICLKQIVVHDKRQQ